MKTFDFLFAFTKWKYVGEVGIVENLPKVPKSPKNLVNTFKKMPLLYPPLFPPMVFPKPFSLTPL